MKYVTLQRNDPQFLKYLSGDFSIEEIAVPVKTLNVGLDTETITFEVKSKKEVLKPSFFIFWSQLVKLNSFHLIIVPFLYVLFKNIADQRFFDPKSFWFASLALVFFFISMNIRNDINDHFSGFDRVNDVKSRPIQRGWITASESALLSMVFLFLSAVAALPVLINQEEERRVVIVVLALITMGRFFKKNTYKNQLIGEFVLFMIMGPGLMSGLQVAMGSGIDTEVLAFGIFWGLAVLFLNHLNHFCHLLTCAQAGLKNVMTRFGFDHCKRIFIFWIIGLNILWILYHFFYASTFWSWFTGITLVFWSIPTLIKIGGINSPLGSDLKEARLTGYKNYFLMCALLILEMTWYAGNALRWTL